MPPVEQPTQQRKRGRPPGRRPRTEADFSQEETCFPFLQVVRGTLVHPDGSATTRVTFHDPVHDRDGDAEPPSPEAANAAAQPDPQPRGPPADCGKLWVWHHEPSAWSAANDHVNLLGDHAHCPLVYTGDRCACRASADLCLTVCCCGCRVK